MGPFQTSRRPREVLRSSEAMARASPLFPGPVGRTGPASLLGRFRTADQMLPGTKGVAPDGKSLFLTFPPTSPVVFFGTDKLAVADPATNLITDVIQIYDKPTLLAMPPPAL